RSHRLKISSDDIASVVATMTGIPVKKVMKSEAKYLMQLEKHLNKKVIGQTEAISAVAKSIRRNRSGVGDARRPIGSFIFLGPTGVGKTELARVLAAELFNSEDALVKIDMSEFSEKHSAARLVGAPAGYVGYDDGGQLTDTVRRQPYSLVLFDEIEKAHPEVFNMLLQVLEDGYLTDAKGRRVDFTNTVVIMTSNIGAEKLQKEASLGFRASKSDDIDRLSEMHKENVSRVRDELKNMMRPELLNRIDKIIVFKALTKANVKKILDLQLTELKERLSKKNLGLQVSTAAKKKLVAEGYDPKNGVRPLRRVIQDSIEDRLAEGILSGDFAAGDVVMVDIHKGELQFKPVAG
ncbi:MAG: AAA family ATPase, partial [Candidatus Saccharimonadales bacterium]|nr:AAA family ATPase [Candidatus Saccharimonadales bacterium]